MKIFTLWDALKQGKQLANAATWKNRQIAASAVASIVGGIVVVLPWLGVNIEVSNEDIVAIAGGVAAVGGIINSLLTAATSKKVGLSSRPKPTAPDPVDSSPGFEDAM